MKTIKISAALLLLLIISIYLFFFSSIIFPWQKEEAIKITLNWGGLDELPKGARNLSIEKTGSLLTRTFIIEFEANQEEIESWISDSPRLKDNVPKVNGNKRLYEIYPGENKSHGGKVIIEKDKIIIRMSWS